VVLTSEVRLHREGLVSKLTAETGIALVASAETLAGASRFLEEGAADIALLDVAASPENLSELSAAVVRAPEARFVVLGVVEADEAMAWAEAGAAGFLEPGGTIDELRVVLDGVMIGELRCSPRIAAALLRRVRAMAREQHRPKDTLGRLTTRELEIMDLIGQGMSNKEIAERTGLRMPTVKNHVRRILQKLEVSGRADVAAIAGSAPRSSGPRSPAPASPV
jgi:two-component system nitrate/nitrite response regulator NarL